MESSQPEVEAVGGDQPAFDLSDQDDVEEDDEGPPPVFVPDTKMEIEHKPEDEGPSTSQQSLETLSVPVGSSDAKLEGEDDSEDQEEGSPQAPPIKTEHLNQNVENEDDKSSDIKTEQQNVEAKEEKPSDIKIKHENVESEEEKSTTALDSVLTLKPGSRPPLKQVPSGTKIEEGPPPGYNFEAQPLPEVDSSDSDVKMEIDEKDDEDEEEEEGPPPGWDSEQPPQVKVVPSNIKMESERQNIEAEEGGPPGWDSKPPQQPQPPSPKDSSLSKDSLPAASLSSEKSQLICGSCRRLLGYPRGAKYVKCSCCDTVNLVLEAQQVGQIKCGNCTLLLMYPYGAPAVRCSSCRFVTEINAHNRRPPLSAQLNRQPSLPNTLS